MNLYDFLSESIVQLPMSWDDANDFAAFLEERFAKYRDVLATLAYPPVCDLLRTRLNSLNTCCDQLLQSVRSALNGNPHEAYNAVSKALDEVRPELNRQAVTSQTLRTLGLMYRVRRKLAPGLSREDMFHIPFERRHLVATQRYSIPGLPCLYLSGSLYTCWEEMGRPPLHELQIAAFWVKEASVLKVLNFSDRPKRLLRYLEPSGTATIDDSIRDLICAHVMLWPVMASCSIIVKHRDSPFKPEYIVPQMVLQWIRHTSEFDGLCYFSTHVQAVTKPNALPTCNLAFPTQIVKPAGRCSRLCDSFKMTEPIGWELLRAIQGDEGTPGHAIPMFDLEFVNGIEEPYYKTEFGLIQTKLNMLALSIINANRCGDVKLGDIKE